MNEFIKNNKRTKMNNKEIVDSIPALRVSEAKPCRSPADVMKTVKKAETKASFDRPAVFDSEELKAFFRVGATLYRIEQGRALVSNQTILEGVIAHARPELSSSAIGLLAKRFIACECVTYNNLLESELLRPGPVEWQGLSCYNSNVRPLDTEACTEDDVRPVLDALNAICENSSDAAQRPLLVNNILSTAKQILKIRVANSTNLSQQVPFISALQLHGRPSAGKSFLINEILPALTGCTVATPAGAAVSGDMFNAKLLNHTILHLEDKRLDSEAALVDFLITHSSVQTIASRAMHKEAQARPAGFWVCISYNDNGLRTAVDTRSFTDLEHKLCSASLDNCAQACSAIARLIDTIDQTAGESVQSKYGAKLRSWLLHSYEQPAEYTATDRRFAARCGASEAFITAIEESRPNHGRRIEAAIVSRKVVIADNTSGEIIDLLKEHDLQHRDKLPLWEKFMSVSQLGRLLSKLTASGKLSKRMTNTGARYTAITTKEASELPW